jgi:hypothetical protein
MHRLFEQLPHVTGDLKVLAGFNDEHRGANPESGHQTVAA